MMLHQIGNFASNCVASVVDSIVDQLVVFQQRVNGIDDKRSQQTFAVLFYPLFITLSHQTGLFATIKVISTIG